MTTMITLRRRFAVAVAGVATAAATTVTLAPWLPHQQMPPMSMAQLPTPATARGADHWDYPTRAAAEATAVKSCGYSDCKVLTSFTACGAVAANDRAYQGGVGPTLAAAMKDALTKLGGGYIDTWACN